MPQVKIEVPDSALKEAANGELAAMRKEERRLKKLVERRGAQIENLKRDLKEAQHELSKPNEVRRKAEALVEALSEALGLEVVDPDTQDHMW